jgi:coenzyme F420-0:L-glutamate ligase/coenzyme F420-1:gamma-L-glutamate ligase
MASPMQLTPVVTGICNEETSLTEKLLACMDIQENDILVVSSKICALTEGAAIDLSTLEVSTEAETWQERCGGTSAFRQAVLQETKRMHGTVTASCPLAMLCELIPEGLHEGSILAVNAGLDCSNIQEGYAIGWPLEPIASAATLRSALEEKTGKRIAVLISDSCCRPRRLGVTAMALTVSGMDPLLSQVGEKDIFGNTLSMTHEAVADQLATAANFLMGNANQMTPAVLIRDHGLPLSNFSGWVPGIERGQDLFQGLL